jgi:hypothetical protein
MVLFVVNNKINIMKKKLHYFLAATLLILVSCSSDDSKADLSTKVILPKTLTYKTGADDTYLTDTFTYDGTKIISVTSKLRKTIFTYNGNKIVKEVGYYFDEDKEVKYSETSYSYVNGKLDTVTESISGEYYNKRAYIYNEDGSVKVDMYYVDKQTGIESKEGANKMLYFLNKNLIKLISDIDSQSLSYTSTNVYEYDTNNNAFKNILGFNLLLNQTSFGSETNISSVNNLKKHYITTIHGPDIVFEPYSNIMEYEYDAKGYPIKKTSYDYTGSVYEIVEYTY